MPSFRIGYGSDFTIDSNGVGIGTTFAASGTKLDVVGTLKGDFNVTGVTTLTAYGGFVGQNQHVTEPSTIGVATVGVGTFQQYYETETGFTDLGGVHHGDDQYYNTLSEDLVIDDGQILNITDTDMVGVTTIGEYDPHNHSSYVCAGSLEQVSVTGHFSVPCGGSNDRKDNPIEGTVRFNDDLNTLEFYNGVEWRQFTVTGASGRGVFGGGYVPGSGVQATIDLINISSTGNVTNFGSLSQARRNNYGCSSSIRGIFGAGYATTGNVDTIDYITIASEGNAIDFGNTTQARHLHGSCSSSTRGLFGGGGTPSIVNTIDYISISTIGNALDFGDLFTGRYGVGACSSSIRAVFGGGSTGGAANVNIIDFINIASTGNTVNFGSLSQKRYFLMSCSSSTRGVFSGGITPVFINTIDYVTIASTGNAIYFGDLTQSRAQIAACSSNIRGVFGGGYTPTFTNTIDYITLASTGNAQDFGDLSQIRGYSAGLSDSHGGLGGF